MSIPRVPHAHAAVRILAGAAAVAALASCGDSGSAPVAVATIAVTAPSLPIDVGQAMQMVAIAKDANGNALTRTMSWSSGASTVASVSSTGLVTGVAPGAALITATAGGVSGSATITVRTPVTAPTVATLPASLVTSTSFRANGSVLSNGGITQAVFEWGTTTALGQSCVAGPPFNNTASVPIWCDFTNVRPGTTIYYRAMATNSAGITRGSIASASTLAPAGAAPTIVKITYPAITGGTVGDSTAGTVDWKDPDGDLARVIFQSSNPSVLPSFTIAVAAAGQTTGTQPFYNKCNGTPGTKCNLGTATITVTLEDAAGHRSAPVSFTSTVQ